MDPSTLAARFLQSPEFFLHCTDILQQTAKQCVYNPTYLQHLNDFYIAPLEIDGVTRSHSIPEKYAEFCYYDPNDLMVYGGSAFYAYYLSCKYKNGNKKDEHLFSNIERTFHELHIPPTTDIDATWWPVVNPIKKNGLTLVPTITSPMMRALAEAFQYSLTANMILLANSEFMHRFLSYIPEVAGIVVTATVKPPKLNPYVGVYTIKGSFVFHFESGPLEVELFDVSIHDGANSQVNYTTTKLNSKETNFAYVKQKDLRTLIIPEENGIHTVRVPVLWKFVDQQIILIRNYTSMIWNGLSRSKQMHIHKIHKIHLRLFFCVFLLVTYLLPSNDDKYIQSIFYPRFMLNSTEKQKIIELNMRLGTFLSKDLAGVASCSYDSIDLCFPDPNIVKQLCTERKQLKDSHCPKGGKTRVHRRVKALRTRRNH